VKDQLNLIQERMMEVEALRLKKADSKNDDGKELEKDPNDLDSKSVHSQG
jgi:hypothetical protein